MSPCRHVHLWLSRRICLPVSPGEPDQQPGPGVVQRGGGDDGSLGPARLQVQRGFQMGGRKFPKTVEVEKITLSKYFFLYNYPAG